jgi:hypothetical protein
LIFKRERTSERIIVHFSWPEAIAPWVAAILRLWDGAGW